MVDLQSDYHRRQPDPPMVVIDKGSEAPRQLKVAAMLKKRGPEHAGLGPTGRTTLRTVQSVLLDRSRRLKGEMDQVRTRGRSTSPGQEADRPDLLAPYYVTLSIQHEFYSSQQRRCRAILKADASEYRTAKQVLEPERLVVEVAASEGAPIRATSLDPRFRKAVEASAGTRVA